MSLLKQVLALISRHKILASLLLILAAAFFIRFIGISYGLPQEFIGDEFVQVAISLKMLDTRSLIPNFPDIFYHQPLSAYISTFGISVFLLWQLVTGRFSGIADMRDFYIIHSTDLLVVVRFLAVISGVLTVWLIYLIGRDLFNRRVGLTAAFFGAFDFLLVFTQHTGRVWGYMPVFIALALWTSVKLFKQDRFKNYFLSAGASLLAIANLLPGIITFVPSLVARFFWKNKKLWTSMVLIALGTVIILLMSPRGLGALFYRFKILSDSGLSQKIIGKSVEAEGGSISFVHRFFDTFITLFNYAPVYFVLFLIGVFILWRADRKKCLFLVSFPIIYYLFIGPFFGFGWVARTLVPFSVYFAVISAYAVNRFNEAFFKNSRKFLMLFAVIASAPSILFSVIFDVKITRPDTRTQAISWIYNNLPENSKILEFSQTNEVINQNREVIELIQETVPDKLNTRQKFLLASGDGVYPRPKYFAWDMRSVDPRAAYPDLFKDNKFEYFIKTSWGANSGDLIENTFADKLLIVRFSPFDDEYYDKGDFGNVHNMTYSLQALFKSERFGPIVEIYKIKFK